MTPMTKQLILHVGSPKCGSTYLQRVMLANRSTLAQCGIKYPKPAGRHPGNGTIVSDLDSDGLTDLFGDAHTLLLSHEDLFSMGGRLSQMGEICQSQDVGLTVLVFLRPFSEFIYGDYSQYMKQNIDTYLEEGAAYGGQSFEEFAVARRSQITPIGWLKAWQRTTTIPLRIAHHRQIRPVLEDTIGPQELNWKIEKSASNPSLRVADCEDIANAIAGGVPRAKVLDMYKLAYSKVALTDHGKTFDRTKWLEALFKTQNDKILDEFQFDNRQAA